MEPYGRGGPGESRVGFLERLDSRVGLDVGGVRGLLFPEIDLETSAYEHNFGAPSRTGTRIW
jgi:hypothetical protein